MPHHAIDKSEVWVSTCFLAGAVFVCGDSPTPVVGRSILLPRRETEFDNDDFRGNYHYPRGPSSASVTNSMLRNRDWVQRSQRYATRELPDPHLLEPTSPIINQLPPRQGSIDYLVETGRALRDENDIARFVRSQTNFLPATSTNPPVPTATLPPVIQVGSEDIGYECIICREGFNEGDSVQPVNCGQKLHAECMNRLMEHNRGNFRCPFCRSCCPPGQALTYGEAVDRLAETGRAIRTELNVDDTGRNNHLRRGLSDNFFARMGDHFVRICSATLAFLFSRSVESDSMTNNTDPVVRGSEPAQVSDMSSM